MHHGFWKHHDPRHVLHEPGNPYSQVIREYYRYLDTEIGRLLELVDEECVVLVLSDHGARALDGCFCINEWLIREGYLVLADYPSEPTSFAALQVDWERTQVWGEGGYCARLFFNIRGREPQGLVEPGDAERLSAALQRKLQATTDAHGRELDNRVFRPREIYRAVRNVAPGLIVYLGNLAWRSVGSVGHRTLHLQESDTGPDGCNHAQRGAFVLADPRQRLRGRIDGAHLLDMAPTLLDLAGCDVPAAMQGRSLAACDREPTQSLEAPPQAGAAADSRSRQTGQ
jgi:predicted AlkP superfamily phosphohydrolase/phosphomutase